MKWIKRILLVLVAACALFAVFFAVMFMLDYKSPRQSMLAQNNCTNLTSDTFDILTWNIGYAGLDASMDFFYEGGTRMRQTEAQTRENLNVICNFLKAADTVDFIMLQEVDKCSHRTYNIDECAEISAILPKYYTYFNIDFNVKFIPLPISNPTGKVLAGTVFCSAHKCCELWHYAYPNDSNFFLRPFLYDRCFTAARYNLKNGKQLVIINNHNSAFDDGRQRNAEMQLLKQFLLSEYDKGNFVVAGGDWNQNPPMYDATSARVKNFAPLKISADFLPPTWHWVVGKHDTNRYQNRPYIEGKSETTMLDFFVISPNVKNISVRDINLHFANSDHNPVVARFCIEP